MKNIIFYVFCAFVGLLFVRAMFEPTLKVEELSYYETPTEQVKSEGSYHIENIYAGCRGLETFKQMATDNPSILIYGKYKKEMSITKEYIRKNLEYFGLQNHLLDCKYII